MVVIVILAISASAIAFRMHALVEKKKFTSQVEGFQSKVIALQKLAVSMQEDWQGVFSKKKKEWVFEAYSDEGKNLVFYRLKDLDVYVNGQAVQGAIIWDFFSSGQVFPKGQILFKCRSNEILWTLPDIFKECEGKNDGPEFS
jgi:type II secretory pathway pseudopilin PulG